MRARKACDGRIRDAAKIKGVRDVHGEASGHSIFWHAISFSHYSLAQYIWEAFPPNTPEGVEVDEVHARRGDTLLHLPGTETSETLAGFSDAL